MVLPSLIGGCADPEFNAALNDFVDTAAVVVGGAAVAAGVSEGSPDLAGQGGQLLGQGLQGFAGTETTGGGGLQPSAGDAGLSGAAGTCAGHPETREGISECYREIARQMQSDEETCRARQANLSSLTGVTPPSTSTGGWGQDDSFEACADLNHRGKLYATCMAEGILDPQNQYYPLQSECAQRYGFQ